MRPAPSAEPVASSVPSLFQSSVVTSLFSSPSGAMCGSTTGSASAPWDRSHSRAVQSPALLNEKKKKKTKKEEKKKKKKKKKKKEEKRGTRRAKQQQDG